MNEQIGISAYGACKMAVVSGCKGVMADIERGIAGFFKTAKDNEIDGEGAVGVFDGGEEILYRCAVWSSGNGDAESSYEL